LISAYRDEIAFVESATRLRQGALRGSVPGRRPRHHRAGRILGDYLGFLQMKARVGIEIYVFGNDASALGPQRSFAPQEDDKPDSNRCGQS